MGSGLRGGDPLLAAQGEGVLVLARDAVALGDVLSRDPHVYPVERLGQHHHRAVDQLGGANVHTRKSGVAHLALDGDEAEGLGVTGHDDHVGGAVDLGEARGRAYGALEPIELQGSFYRRDIGWRAL